MQRKLFFGFLVSMAGLASSIQVASAQADVCGKGRKLLQERQNIIVQINGWSKKKVDPNMACATLGRLLGNGTATLNWMEVNKDWCQVPDQAVEGVKAAQEQIAKNRGSACQAAAQYNKAKKQAQAQAAQRAAQQQSGGGATGGAFGGPDQIMGGGTVPVPRSPL